MYKRILILNTTPAELARWLRMYVWVTPNGPFREGDEDGETVYLSALTEYSSPSKRGTGLTKSSSGNTYTIYCLDGYQLQLDTESLPKGFLMSEPGTPEDGRRHWFVEAASGQRHEIEKKQYRKYILAFFIKQVGPLQTMVDISCQHDHSLKVVTYYDTLVEAVKHSWTSFTELTPKQLGSFNAPDSVRKVQPDDFHLGNAAEKLMRQLRIMFSATYDQPPHPQHHGWETLFDWYYAKGGSKFMTVAELAREIGFSRSYVQLHKGSYDEENGTGRRR